MPGVGKPHRRVGDIAFDELILYSEAMPRHPQLAFLKKCRAILGINKVFSFVNLDFFEAYIGNNLCCN